MLSTEFSAFFGAQPIAKQNKTKVVKNIKASFILVISVSFCGRQCGAAAHVAMATTPLALMPGALW